MKNLVLITNYFPYKSGEEYLEEEIKYISKMYNSVYIFPTMASANDEITRTVPENVVVVPLKLNMGFFSKLGFLFNSRENISNDDKKRTSNYFQIIYSKYYIGRVNYVVSQILKTKEWKEVAKSNSVIIYSYWLHVTASVAARLKSSFGTTSPITVARGHRYDLYNYASPVKFIPDRELTFSKLDQIFPCSLDGTEYLRKQFPQFASKISTKYLGVSNDRLYSSQFSKDNEVFTIVSCSGIRKVKRLDKIIQVIKKLLNLGVNVVWKHIGTGDDFNQIKDYATRTIPEVSFQFLGSMKNSAVKEFYSTNCVDLFINLSESEGIPVSIMEAFSFGIPVAATNVGGTGEIVINGFNGLLFEENEKDDLIAEKIRDYLLLDPKYKNDFSRNARETWNKSFNSKVNYIDFHNSLINLQNGE